MKLRVLDQITVTAIQPDALRPRDEVEVSDAFGAELLRRHPTLFEEIAGETRPAKKAAPKPKNKAARKPRSKIAAKPAAKPAPAPAATEKAPDLLSAASGTASPPAGDNQG
jgi:hypothetical protein